MNSKTLSAVAAIVAGLSASQFASAAQAPNYYECSGRNVSLSLTIGSKAEVGIRPPQTQLNLQVGQKNHTFAEADITTEATLIGDLWEVVLHAVPDLYVEHAAVIIPSISLADSPLNFKSQLVLTRVATPFSPEAFEGVVNPSRYIDISCIASVLYY
ncbi:hypothetical protein [Methylomonas albis]|jgi:hypothetical protein|uniref:Uncharacterized protein n=1 Tax=Methylomonas albis TaxID=1854563 RepID=A0ABR9D5J5_9GAMM|nr:hypothetical protein [Methylomonas albis]MBD9358381.1 hypothetical protein [Methylomonas albis]CAD6881777.1 hypothetical protein [Methylomonas albis]